MGAAELRSTTSFGNQEIEPNAGHAGGRKETLPGGLHEVQRQDVGPEATKEAALLFEGRTEDVASLLADESLVDLATDGRVRSMTFLPEMPDY